MATIASAAAGNWSNTATWSGGVVPGNGDTVTLGHNVTVDVDTTIGVSGVNGTAAITITTNNRVLTIASGVRLTLRGDLIYRGTYGNKTYVLVLNAGAKLRFDSSQAASPSTTKYNARPNGGGTCASILINGTATDICEVDSDAGGGNGWFSRNGFGATGDFEAYYCNFTRIGDATNPFYQIQYGDNGINANKTILDHCILDACGIVEATNALQTNGTWRATDSTFRNSQHATRSMVSPTATNSGTTKTLANSVFDKEVAVGDGAYEIGGAIFLEGNNSGARTVVTVQTAGPLFLRRTTQPAIDALGDYNDFYFIKDDTGGSFSNPHFLTQLGRVNRNYSMQNGVLEYTGTDNSGDAFATINTASARVHTLKNNLCLPVSQGAGAGRGFGKFLSGGSANVDWVVEHNTYPSDKDDVESGISHGELAGEHAGMFDSIKSNLAWSPTSGQSLVLSRLIGTLQDAAAAADVTYNVTWNGFSGSDGVGFHSHSVGTMFSGSGPGGTNFNIATDPFVDRTRRMATWDAALGGPGTVANALAELAKKNDRTGYNSAYSVAALLEWVRDGFKVKDASLRDAGHDGVTIGALPAVADITATATLPIGFGLTGVADVDRAPELLAEATLPIAFGLTSTAEITRALNAAAVLPIGFGLFAQVDLVRAARAFEASVLLPITFGLAATGTAQVPADLISWLVPFRGGSRYLVPFTRYGMPSHLGREIAPGNDVAGLLGLIMGRNPDTGAIQIFQGGSVTAYWVATPGSTTPLGGLTKTFAVITPGSFVPAFDATEMATVLTAAALADRAPIYLVAEAADEFRQYFAFTYRLALVA